MERKAYMQLAATKAKSLKPGQMIRITAEERYYIMRDQEGRLYIGQTLQFNFPGEEVKGKPFFALREEFKQQRADKAIIGYWQKFMPTKEEAQRHGVNTSNGITSIQQMK